MTDNTEYKVRAAVFVDDHALTVPITPDAQLAVDMWLTRYTDELAEVLKPFGLHPYDLASPRIERVVYPEDLV